MVNQTINRGQNFLLDPQNCSILASEYPCARSHGFKSIQREGELPTERVNREKSQSLAYVIPSGKGHTSNYVCSVRSKPDSSGCTNVKKINKSEIKACTVILNWALWELYNASAHLWIGDLRSCYEHFGQFYRNTKTWIMSISVNFIETPKHGCGGNHHIKGNIRVVPQCVFSEGIP